MPAKNDIIYLHCGTRFLSAVNLSLLLSSHNEALFSTLGHFFFAGWVNPDILPRLSVAKYPIEDPIISFVSEIKDVSNIRASSDDFMREGINNL